MRNEEALDSILLAGFDAVRARAAQLCTLEICGLEMTGRVHAFDRHVLDPVDARLVLWATAVVLGARSALVIRAVALAGWNGDCARGRERPSCSTAPYCSTLASGTAQT